MAVFRRNSNWYIDFYFQGKRIRECVGPSKKLAQQALDVRKGEIAQKKYGLQETGHIKFESVTEKYLNHVRTYKRSYIRDQLSIRHLTDFFGGKYLNEITPYLIEEYKQNRLEFIKPATVNRELACLKYLFNLAINWELATTNPVTKIKFFKEELLPLKILSGEEVNQLISACLPHLKPIVIMALHTGMRRGEILNLKWESIDFDTGLILVANSKNSENRYIPISSYLAQVLSNLRKVSSYVFVNPNTKRPYSEIRQAFHSAVKTAGLARMRFHDLRHNFASQMVMSGVDIVTVKEILGHRSIKMTMRYSHLTQDHKKSAVERLMIRYGHNMDPEGKSLKLANS